jgi:hypothetical protein
MEDVCITVKHFMAGCAVALLCITPDTWSYEMVPRPFFSHPSKKQLRVCGVLRRNVTVKGSSL